MRDDQWLALFGLIFVVVALVFILGGCTTTLTPTASLFIKKEALEAQAGVEVLFIW